MAFGSDVATDDEFHLGLELAVPNPSAIPIFGPGTSQTPLGDGFLCVTPPTCLSVLKLDAAGAGHYQVLMGENPALSQITNLVPITMNFQVWYRDAGSSNLTDAVTVDFL